MHVNRAGDLFSILGEGVWKGARKEMKSCKHESTVFLPAPFLD